ncbi:hypothetical protein OO007_17480 [Cocleimonas sp. KMM 6892]|uniref:hypothetical protein n=1 Tax=unclassified Cocleimonas TaxID=2639732 RepID=UPI002DBBAB75|nr:MULTISPECIES: hypothetical protein [unclassified Cocleimonas]MEB8434035.1 hypothetical protein [Cocleimonas sp. KMM 6892]MEC4716846.1 hypothetical protein [Cocleimonas sp. KMM 6895]MEC4745999.1 hypothetical protein [Cocleimonas sp. KMM 6896]
MNIIKIIILFALLNILPNIATAQINKCTIDGKTIYQSAPCPVSETNENAQSSFGFDGWKFGTSIHKAKQIARQRQLAMTPGTSAIHAKYNAKVINRQPNARVYSYRSKIMDKTTTVRLYFTKTTEELYQVKVIFHVNLLKPEERKYFYEALHAQLTEKYGKANNISREDVKRNSQGLGGVFAKSIQESLVGNLQAWGVKTDNLVTLNYKEKYQNMMSYELTYQYRPLVSQNKREITYDMKQRTSNSILKDGGKL